MKTPTTVAMALQQLNDFEEFPTQAVQFLADHKAESTPVLLEILKNAAIFYKKVNPNDGDYMAAIYLLSEFREQRAFPYIMKLAALPESHIDTLFSDAADDFPKWMVSTFNGNLQPIQQLIENESVDLFQREYGLQSLVALVFLEKLPKATVIDYFKKLLSSDLTNDDEFSAFLVANGCDLDGKALYPALQSLFEKNLVDTTVIDLDGVNTILAQESYTSESAQDLLITNAQESMSEWFESSEEEDELLDAAMNMRCCDKDDHSVAS